MDDGRDRLSRFYRVPLVVNPQLTDLALFRVGLHGAQVGPTAFGLISFGGATALHTPAQHNQYIFYGARASGIVLSQSGLADTYSTRGDGHIATTDARIPLLARFDTGAELFAVAFDRAAVEAELEEELGHAVSGLHFPASLSTNAAPQRTYKALLGLLTDELTDPTGLLDRPAVADRLGRALLTTMLHSAPHQYADELAVPRPSGPHAVRIVTAALHADPAHPYTAVELARLAGVSLRSLQDAFRAHHGMPMMTYLRNLRLDGAHQDLLNEQPPGVTVADIATRWGFFHLSRFATYYRQRHGALPSQHLRH
ncbi:helix-turn-helix domain-containing protein [Streptomyces sp. NPDC050703]|uniref:AraC family transcriptional regulator n=1 Tax=Streptomyces sp. NPDC050703 TaxID=3157218 RepID=UPI003442B86E